MTMTVAKLAFQARRTPLMKMLLRDGVCTFLALTCMYIYLSAQRQYTTFIVTLVIIFVQLVNQGFDKNKAFERACFAYVFRRSKTLKCLWVFFSWYLAFISIGVRRDSTVIIQGLSSLFPSAGIEPPSKYEKASGQ